MIVSRAIAAVALLTVIAFPGMGTARTDAASGGADAPSAVSTRPSIENTSAAPEMREAAELLGILQRTYRHLDGVTVSSGTPANGSQAAAYYTLGRITIDPAHEAALADILVHEIWHIIDWRDNGRIDWGENVPPAEKSAYLK